MTQTLREELLGVIGSNAVELGHVETQVIFDTLEAKFAKPGRSALWERLLQRSSIQDPAGWKRVSEFVVGPGLLLVEGEPSLNIGLRFATGADLVHLLGASSGFEFYVTDEAAAFVLAFNHHDFLIGAGTARPWVESLLRKSQTRQ